MSASSSLMEVSAAAVTASLRSTARREKLRSGTRLPGVQSRSFGRRGQVFARSTSCSHLLGARAVEIRYMVSWTTPLRGQRCLSDGRRQLGPAISKAGMCSCAASMADSGDAPPGMDDYIPNFADKGFLLRIRALCFYMWTYAVALPLFLVMMLLQPFVLLFDKNRRMAQHWVNRIWAWLTIALFYEAEITGSENLPSTDEPAVYVANHQSFLDIYTLFLLGRPFKFISKTSNFFIPIIGWSMYLTGHVPLRRLDKRSQMECLQRCIQLVKMGVPVLFFPEGTRSSDGKMSTFKKGAFTIAIRGNVPVVPISLIGTGKLMPNGLESTLRPGKVKIVIHPQIQGNNAEDLCKQTRDAIARTLVEHGMPVL